MSWATYYNYINRCNEILENFGNVQMWMRKGNNMREKPNLQGLCFISISFGFRWSSIGTQTISIDEGYKIPRSGIEETYDQIVKDLLDASELLPASYVPANKGRATKWQLKDTLERFICLEVGIH
jgi:hypothetical protein